MQRLVLLAILLQGASALVTNSSQAAAWRDTAGATQRKDGAKPVFYAVIMGRLAFRHQVSLWLSSLRKLGHWEGVAVIVTDRPTCLAETLKEAELIGKKLSSTESVDIFAPGTGDGAGKGNVHMVKRPIAHSINMMKLEKARGWLNVHVAAIPHPVSSIVYTDEDIVIARDLNLFMDTVRSLENAKHTLALFRDTGASAGELHTGVVVMFPGQGTDTCLQAWGKALTGKQIGSAQAKFNLEIAQEEAVNENHDADADTVVIKEDQLLDEELAVMGPDQQALGRTKACKKDVSGSHDGIRILPGKFFWLPTPGGMGGKIPHVAEFVHFTNTGRWKLISHKSIKAYLTKIGVPANIDPTGSVKALECAIPAGGTAADVNKGPTHYGR